MYVNSTEAAPRAVPAPMMIRTDVALSQTGDVASTPELGGAPTLAVNDALMKLAPYTVTVLPTYATEGATEVAIGLLLMVSGVPGTVATNLSFANFNSTDAAPSGVPLFTYTITILELIQSTQYAAVPLLGINPTFALILSYGLMKLVPYTVIMVPA